MTADNEIQSEVQRLASLTRLEYDRERLSTAERLGVRVSTLDNEVGKHRSQDPKGEVNDGGGILEPVRPWPTPVAGNELLTAIKRILRRFVVMPDWAVEAIALWIVFAHAHDAAEHSPTLAIESPEKRCGKTNLLNIIGQLVPVPLPTANITTAALFRSISKFRPTLLLDEVETFTRDNDEMRGVLNSGFTRRSAYVVRSVGENHDPLPFSTWCPKVCALIGELPDTLQDRSIVILLRRRLSHEMVERFGQRHHAELHELRAKAARWAEDHLHQLRNSDVVVPDGLNDRAEDAWRPLLAIADVAGSPWPELARQAAIALSGERESAKTASAGVLLLEHIRELFAAHRIGEMPSKQLADLLSENEAWPWGEWHGKPITPHGVARLLKRYDIQPRKRSASNVYLAADFRDAWQRYLSTTASSESSRSPSHGEHVSVAKGLSLCRVAGQSSKTVTPLELPPDAETGVNAGIMEVLEDGKAGPTLWNGHDAQEKAGLP